MSGSTVAKGRRRVRRLRKETRRRTPRPCRPQQAGDTCSECGKGRLDLDGVLQLSCPVCGHVAQTGGFT